MLRSPVVPPRSFFGGRRGGLPVLVVAFALAAGCGIKDRGLVSPGEAGAPSADSGVPGGDPAVRIRDGGVAAAEAGSVDAPGRDTVAGDGPAAPPTPPPRDAAVPTGMTPDARPPDLAPPPPPDAAP